MPHTNNKRRTIPSARLSQTNLIRRFHAIEKELTAADLSVERKKRLLKERDEQLGGLEAYQNASVHGGDKQRGGESSKWLVRQLLDLPSAVIEWRSKSSERRSTYVRLLPAKLRILDVGAITGTAYLKWPWIEAVSIDLNSQHERVIACDFFDYPPPAMDERKFDIVCLSLVVNFVGALEDRGRMLTHAHRYVEPDRGLLYIVLPLACVSNSRFLTHEKMRGILASAGWRVVSTHDSAKLCYLLCQADLSICDGRVHRKEKLREGIERNNFAIVLNDPLPVSHASRAEEWHGIEHSLH